MMNSSDGSTDVGKDVVIIHTDNNTSTVTVDTPPPVNIDADTDTVNGVVHVMPAQSAGEHKADKVLRTESPPPSYDVAMAGSAPTTTTTTTTIATPITREPGPVVVAPVVVDAPVMFPRRRGICNPPRCWRFSAMSWKVTLVSTAVMIGLALFTTTIALLTTARSLNIYDDDSSYGYGYGYGYRWSGNSFGCSSFNPNSWSVSQYFDANDTFNVYLDTNDLLYAQLETYAFQLELPTSSNIECTPLWEQSGNFWSTNASTSVTGCEMGNACYFKLYDVEKLVVLTESQEIPFWQSPVDPIFSYLSTDTYAECQAIGLSYTLFNDSSSNRTTADHVFGDASAMLLLSTIGTECLPNTTVTNNTTDPSSRVLAVLNEPIFNVNCDVLYRQYCTVAGRPFTTNNTTNTNTTDTATTTTATTTDTATTTQTLDALEHLQTELVLQTGGPASTWLRTANQHVGNAPVLDGQQTSTVGMSYAREEYIEQGIGEHTSVASFGRVAMQLLSLGSPADLLSDTLQAAQDEIEHAILCFSIASSYGGESTATATPGRFPFPHDGLTVQISAADMALATVQEGILGETIAAMSLFVRAQIAELDSTRAKILTQIGADEARHAALAFRTVGWLLYEHADQKTVRIALQQFLTQLTQQQRPSPTTATSAAHHSSVISNVVLTADDAVYGQYGLLDPKFEHLLNVWCTEQLAVPMLRNMLQVQSWDLWIDTLQQEPIHEKEKTDIVVDSSSVGNAIRNAVTAIHTELKPKK